MTFENGRTEEQRQMIMTGDDDMGHKKDMQDRWKKNEDKRHAERHDRFPEDDIVGIITISR